MCAQYQNQQESCKSDQSASLYIFKMLCGLRATVQHFQHGGECDNINSNAWNSDSPRIPRATADSLWSFAPVPDWNTLQLQKPPQKSWDPFNEDLSLQTYFVLKIKTKVLKLHYLVLWGFATDNKIDPDSCWDRYCTTSCGIFGCHIRVMWSEMVLNDGMFSRWSLQPVSSKCIWLSFSEAVCKAVADDRKCPGSVYWLRHNQTVFTSNNGFKLCTVCAWLSVHPCMHVR